MGVALFLVVGGPLALLQCGAWVNMVHDFSKTGSISQAVSKTFDGHHLCPLCKKLARARSAEEKAPLTLKVEKKAEAFIVQSNSEVPVPSCREFVFAPFREPPLPEVFSAPPVPVPRDLLS